jgi:hypothetical protein
MPMAWTEISKTVSKNETFEEKRNKPFLLIS